MSRVTIGCDPEFFIKDSNGKFISSIGKIPGTKEAPFYMPSGAGLQHDNVAIEFSSPVAKDGEDLVNKIRSAISEIKQHLPSGTTISVAPSASFDDSELTTPESKEFGCDPDYNAWTLEENTAPVCENPNFRSCGGHFHVGHVEGDGNAFLLDPYGKVDMIKAMDCVHGIISILLDNSSQASDRRLLYGRAGCHRPTEYGIEYRVMSNFWMKSPRLVLLMDSLANDAIAIIKKAELPLIIDEIGEERIQTIINCNLVEDAKDAYKNVIKNYISKQSIDLLNECLDNINRYDFEKEWE